MNSRHYQALMWLHFEDFRTLHCDFFLPKNRTARSYSSTVKRICTSWWIPLPSQLLLRQTAACGCHTTISPISCPQLIHISSSRSWGDQTGLFLLNTTTPSCFRINSCWEPADCVRLPGDPGRYCCASFSHTTFARFSLKAKKTHENKGQCVSGMRSLKDQEYLPEPQSLSMNWGRTTVCERTSLKRLICPWKTWLNSKCKNKEMHVRCKYSDKPLKARTNAAAFHILDK